MTIEIEIFAISIGIVAAVSFLNFRRDRRTNIVIAILIVLGSVLSVSALLTAQFVNLLDLISVQYGNFAADRAMSVSAAFVMPSFLLGLIVLILALVVHSFQRAVSESTSVNKHIFLVPLVALASWPISYACYVLARGLV